MPWIDQLGADFAAVVSPLSPLGEQPVGAWSVTYDSEHHWSPHERALISTLTDLAGQALKRIRLQKARIELATALQQRPHTLIVTSWKPQREVKKTNSIKLWINASNGP